MSAGPPSGQPALVIRDLRVVRGGHAVLSGVNLSVGATERVSVEGVIGSGKSSLLWAALGLIDFTGSIEIFGQARRTEQDFIGVRGQVALLFQDPDDQLIGPSVLEDVMFGPLNLGLSPEVSRDRAQQTLAQLTLNDLQQRSVRSLSGGQKRLVALAGILSMHPRLLLLDEPTTGLDAEAAKLIVRVLAGLSQPMLFVSHDPACLEGLATRRCVLRDGVLGERESGDAALGDAVRSGGGLL